MGDQTPAPRAKGQGLSRKCTAPASQDEMGEGRGLENGHAEDRVGVDTACLTVGGFRV